MKKGIFLNIIIFILFASVVLAGAIITSFNAKSDGDNIVVTWETSSETGVKNFNVLRGSSVDGPFMVIHEEPAKGYGSRYQFIDKSVFKTGDANSSLYSYKLEIVMNDGSKAAVKAISVFHDQVSSVKKTWGSIKALFR